MASSDGRTLPQWLSTATQIAAPITLVSTLLFYFGYVYTKSQYAYFGVDVDTIGLTPRDYVMRSPQPLLVPLLVLVVLSVAAVALSRPPPCGGRRAAGAPRRRRSRPSGRAPVGDRQRRGARRGPAPPARVRVVGRVALPVARVGPASSASARASAPRRSRSRRRRRRARSPGSGSSSLRRPSGRCPSPPTGPDADRPSRSPATSTSSPPSSSTAPPTCTCATPSRRRRTSAG